MMRSVRLLLLLILFFTSYSVRAQEPASIKINGEFNNVSATEFFKGLEVLIPSYKFYYDASKLDSFTVKLSITNLSLTEVLEAAFKGTDIQFAVDTLSKNIFITQKVKIYTELPDNFFNEKKKLNVNNNLPDSLLDYEEGYNEKTKVAPGRLIEIGRKTNQTRNNVIITGYVRNVRTGEPLTNVSVFTDSLHSTITDIYGHYSLMVTSGNHTLSVSTIGMKDIRLQLAVYSEGKLDIDMNEEIRVLKEVLVSNRKSYNIRNVQMGVERLSIEKIKSVPTVFGESDVLRVVTSLPGVKTVGEASTGFNVRGGSADQNLILFNEATIYNPSHFFGLFSAFNPEVVEGIELYKSSIPANYGGRLSSVLDIKTREGNKKNITGSAGIGLVTSRVHLEGPLIKNKTSFIMGARTTYANWLLNLLPQEYKNSTASFQDIDFSVSHKIDSSNDLYLNGYFSNDKFSLGSDTTYGYSNRNANIKWKHNFSSKFRGVFIAGYDQYQYNVSSNKNEVNAFKLGFDVKQSTFKSDFTYFLNTKHSLDFGLSSVYYKLHPGYFEPYDSNSAIQRDEVNTEQALESGLYLAHHYSPNNKLSVSSGIRYSIFNFLGPQEVSIYTPGSPVTESSRTGTIAYGKGKFINTYKGPEIRLSLRYILTPTLSVKAAYNSLRQYIHLLSNTAIIAPTDIWKLSDPNIRPQKGEQVSLGFYKNFKSNTIETSVELYYKKIKDYLDYKPGGTLFLNHNIETDVINTKGKGYGVEVLLKKPGGKLNGWISYTYSRILLNAYDSTQGVSINNGKYYPANYDKPHDVTLAGNFRVNHRFSVSLNFNYSTGRPITLPIARFYYAGSERVLYSDRNQYRIPDYFRTDFSMNIDGNHKVHQKTHNSWTIGIYNVLGRQNPYSVYFVSEDGKINGYKLSIFGSAIPFVNFNIRF